MGKRRWDETKVAQLERKVGQQAVEIDFLKACLQKPEEPRMLQAPTGRPLSIMAGETEKHDATVFRCRSVQLYTLDRQ